MAWPTDQVATGDLITAGMLNRLLTMLADTKLAASAGSIDFTSIPAHWTHLLLVLNGRGTNAAVDLSLNLTFNNDAAGNYDVIKGAAFGTTPVVEESLASAGISLVISGGNATANVSGSALVLIPSYTDTTLEKTVAALNPTKRSNTTGNIFSRDVGGFWRSTAAINRITLSAADFAIGTRATLYGLGRL